MIYQYKCEKLFGGYVAIRDYNLGECLSKEMDLALMYKNNVIVIPNDQIREKVIKLDDKIYPSMYGRPYKLLYVKWGAEKTDNKQAGLF